MFPEKLRPSQANRYPPYNFPWYQGTAEDPFGTPISEGDILAFFRDPRGILFETQFFVAYMPAITAINELNPNAPKYFQTRTFRDILRERKNPFTKQPLVNLDKEILFRRASFHGYDSDPLNNYNTNTDNENNATATTKSFDSTYSIGSRSSVATNDEELLFPMNMNGGTKGGKRMMHQWAFLHRRNRKSRKHRNFAKSSRTRKSHRSQTR